MTDVTRLSACLALGLALTGVGCTQTATVRGQSPLADEGVRPAAGAMTPGGIVPTTFHGGAYGNCPTGTCKPGLGMPLGQGLAGFGPYGCKPGLGGGDLFAKKHMNVYSYTQPAPLAYPEGTNGQGSPMPVVRYPYYPVKGPDDFFYDKDGKF